MIDCAAAVRGFQSLTQLAIAFGNAARTPPMLYRLLKMAEDYG
jgi:hypothetical protein